MTEHEKALIKAKREGYVCGVLRSTNTPFSERCLMESAAKEFPFPKTTRPREVSIRDCTYRLGENGQIQYCYDGDDTWDDDPAATRDDVLKILDLFDNPLEEVSE